MVHPVSTIMQLSSLARSWKRLELETEGGVAGMVGPGGKKWGIPPGRLLEPLAGVKVCTRGRAMLRVSGKRLFFSVLVVMFWILVILPPNFSEEIWTHEVQVSGAAILAVRVNVNTSNHCPQYKVQTTQYFT